MVILPALITANLVGIGANLDNCGVGIAYGSEHVKFPHWVNAVVNAVGFCTAILGAFLGDLVSRYISSQDAQWAACVVLCFIGVYFWYAAYIVPRVSGVKHRMKVAKPGLKQGILLGFALSFSNIASGFGATVSSAADIWTTACAITLWGYVMIWAGNIVGTGLLAKLLGNYSSMVAGLLLILVGIHQVLV